LHDGDIELLHAHRYTKVVNAHNNIAGIIAEEKLVKRVKRVILMVLEQ